MLKLMCLNVSTLKEQEAQGVFKPYSELNRRLLCYQPLHQYDYRQGKIYNPGYKKTHSKTTLTLMTLIVNLYHNEIMFKLDHTNISKCNQWHMNSTAPWAHNIAKTTLEFVSDTKLDCAHVMIRQFRHKPS